MTTLGSQLLLWPGRISNFKFLILNPNLGCVCGSISIHWIGLYVNSLVFKQYTWAHNVGKKQTKKQDAYSTGVGINTTEKILVLNKVKEHLWFHTPWGDIWSYLSWHVFPCHTSINKKKNKKKKSFCVGYYLIFLILPQILTYASVLYISLVIFINFKVINF